MNAKDTVIPAIKLNKLKQLIEERKNAEKLKTDTKTITENTISTDKNTILQDNNTTITDHSIPITQPIPKIDSISYNEEQEKFITTAVKGDSCILIGAAGTGKTTCMKGTVQALIQSGKVGTITNTDDHKYLRAKTPGIVCVAFTRRAVANLRKAMPEDLKKNCLTIHALLEFRPEESTVIDEKTGKEFNRFVFAPTRTMDNPLPEDINTIIIDESSMVSVELFRLLTNALSHDVQFIFLGDIQQLPPVFGSAILGYKMLELPTIELTQVYRQALDSPIIRLAHRILSGKTIPVTDFPEWNTSTHDKDGNLLGKVTLHPWKKKLSPDLGLLTAAKFFTTALDAELYNIEEDIILIPYNKSFGTDELNKYIASHIAKKEMRTVHEIISGYNKLYFSIGDKVLFEKEDATIVDIKPNPSYFGKSPQEASTAMDYWGYVDLTNSGAIHTTNIDDSSIEDIDFLLEQAALQSGQGEERVNQSSHIVVLRQGTAERDIPVQTSADINNLLLGYAITVHKSQGSEWGKVFVVFHQSHATMLQRELLYTAVTRAKTELYVICEPGSFINGIQSQRIKGNTLAEKAEYFKGKQLTDGNTNN